MFPTSNELVVIQKDELRSLIEDIVFKCLKTASLYTENELEKEKKAKIFLTRKDAAALLKVSLPTLDSHTLKGNIPVRYIGRKILYEESELLHSLSSIKSFMNKKNQS